MTVEADRSAQHRSWGRLALRALVLIAAFLSLVAFSVVLAKVTLTPSPASEGIVTSNMQPGRSLRQYAQDYTFLAACKQAGGNLLLGAPFGVLLPILVPRRLRMIRMVLLTGLVMAVVELTQGALVAGRAFDVDDVILNTSGALLGYALVGRRISHRYHALSDVPPVGDTARVKPTGKAADRNGAKSRAGTKSRTGARNRADSKAGIWARAGVGAGAKTGTRNRPGARTGSAKAVSTKASAGRSASASATRGRALIGRMWGRRPGPGGGASGTGRRGT
ncbi:VanZ family protein [Streptomyces sp. NPDC005566]|uniref:VanZ family protein n=1 Tax=Streptomyces sp. NPDC005566 TaxID=3156886 RepID=UPI0033ADDB9F